MTRPEEAIERARAAVASMRAGGAYSERESELPGPPDPAVTSQKLLAWALIEPDESGVRSTRRRGGAITAGKRALLRLLAQYHAELIANQTRFNLNLLVHVQRLEHRISELEQRHSGASLEQRHSGASLEQPHSDAGRKPRRDSTSKGL